MPGREAGATGTRVTVLQEQGQPSVEKSQEGLQSKWHLCGSHYVWMGRTGISGREVRGRVVVGRGKDGQMAGRTGRWRERRRVTLVSTWASCRASAFGFPVGR